jgi:hypothetical protein
MSGQEILYVAIAIVVAIVVVVVVSRRRGGKGVAKWGDKSLTASGQDPPGRVEVGKGAELKSVDAVSATGVSAEGEAAVRAAEGGVSVGERLKVEGAKDVNLVGVDQRAKTPGKT